MCNYGQFCIVSEIKRNIGIKPRIFIPLSTLHPRPRGKHLQIYLRCFFSQPSDISGQSGRLNRFCKHFSIYFYLFFGPTYVVVLFIWLFVVFTVMLLGWSSRLSMWIKLLIFTHSSAHARYRQTVGNARSIAQRLLRDVRFNSWIQTKNMNWRK